MSSAGGGGDVFSFSEETGGRDEDVLGDMLRGEEDLESAQNSEQVRSSFLSDLVQIWKTLLGINFTYKIVILQQFKHFIKISILMFTAAIVHI